MAAHIVAPSLTAIINASLSTGFVIDDWKVAKVTPAYKGKGDIMNTTYYRPLSVVAHVSKIVEKLIQQQVMKFITNDQSAYLKRHSTQTCLHRLVDDILDNRNQGEVTGLCFLDIQKCFDTIDHSILLDQMYHYGFRNIALMWFTSYMSNRKQIVVYNSITSLTNVVPTGVPQGTVLGPLLFLLYLNDLSTAVNNACINIYADDVVIYASNKSFYLLRQNLQSTLSTVFNWYRDNKLTLSISKCSSMVIDCPNRMPNQQLNLTCNGIQLQQLDSVKYLGVVIDNRSKCDKHITDVTKRVSFNNYRLRMLRHILPRDVLLQIFKATSIPIMDCASSVWGCFSKSIVHCMKRLENAAARAITGNYDFINVRGDTLCNELQLTRFDDRCKYHTALLMFKAVHGMAPVYICNTICFVHDVTDRNLRSFDNMNLYQPGPNIELFKRSLAYNRPAIWNALPIALKQCTSLSQFKTLYRKEMF